MSDAQSPQDGLAAVKPHFPQGAGREGIKLTSISLWFMNVNMIFITYSSHGGLKQTSNTDMGLSENGDTQ